jgi:hypothetical protein
LRDGAFAFVRSGDVFAGAKKQYFFAFFAIRPALFALGLLNLFVSLSTCL